MFVPTTAALVQSLGLELVGPYHVLAGRLEGVPWEKCTLHSRFFYDPPEMVTVVRRVSHSDQYHLGFFRYSSLTLSVGRLCMIICNAGMILGKVVLSLSPTILAQVVSSGC